MTDRTSYIVANMEDALAEDVIIDVAPRNPISSTTEVVTIDIHTSGGGGVKKSG
jgi:hypothetical protein